VEVRLPAGERELLVHLLGQLDDLLDDGAGPGSTDPLAELVGMDLGEPADSSGPDDPAVARLFPAGSRDDSDAAAEYRRLTERGLRARKRDGARLAASALARGEPVMLDPDEAQALLKSLTDVRLVLAERLDLRTDEDAVLLHERLLDARSRDGPLATTAAIYDVLTWWQESLVGALSRGRR
jgi:hypothetical protein